MDGLNDGRVVYVYLLVFVMDPYPSAVVKVVVVVHAVVTKMWMCIFWKKQRPKEEV